MVTGAASATKPLGATESWDLPASGPAPTGYLLHVSSAIFTGSLPLTTCSIGGPVPPGSYTLSVSATNACGVGPATPPQTVVVP